MVVGSARFYVQWKSFINIEKLRLTFNCPSCFVVFFFSYMQFEATLKKGGMEMAKTYQTTSNLVVLMLPIR